MKFTVEREKLHKALQKIISVSGSRTMMPVLSNVLLKAENGKLFLTGTDLEIRISTSVDAEVEIPGVTTAPAKKLASLANALVGDKVSFDVDDKEHIKLECGTGKYTLLGLPAADFPEEAAVETVRKIVIKENDFKRMVSLTSYAVSVDDSRKVLTGSLLNIKDSMVSLVATDGKRLAIQECAPESVEGGDGDVIIPLKAVSEVRRLTEGSGVLNISIGEKSCIFETESFRLCTKLIEGNYPNYRQVIPVKFNKTIEVDRSLLLSKIETLSLVLTDGSCFVILKFGDNKLELRASSAEIGDGCDLIEIPFEGESFEMSFNPTFIAEPLRNCDANKIMIKLNDPASPLTIEGGEGFLYVIMPIRKK